MSKMLKTLKKSEDIKTTLKTSEDIKTTLKTSEDIQTTPKTSEESKLHSKQEVYQMCKQRKTEPNS